MKKLFFSVCTLLLSFTISASSVEPADSQMIQIATDDTVYIYLDTGTVIVQLAPFIAPKHVGQFKALVREGFYDGLDLYRVIDGFVAQGGDVSEEKQSKNRKSLKAEFTRELKPSSAFQLVQSPEFLAEQTGFLHGFAAGRSLTDEQEWLLHCPGTVAMARDNSADSATTDFYIVIGQAPRHLDRNMSIFGQVIYGLSHVQAAKRGDKDLNGGVIESPSKRTKILSAKLGSDIPETERLNFTTQSVSGEVFQQRLSGARTLDNPFFHYKGTGNVDVCYYRPSINLL